MSINKITLIIFIMCTCLVSCSALNGYVVDAKFIMNISVQEIQEQGRIKLFIKANLAESANSISKIETNTDGEILYIKAYEKFVAFVPNDKLTDEINVELVVPDSVNEIRLMGDNKAIWKRKEGKKI